MGLNPDRTPGFIIANPPILDSLGLNIKHFHEEMTGEVDNYNLLETNMNMSCMRSPKNDHF